MKKFSFSETLPVTSSATAAGTSVIESDGGAGQRHQHGQRHRREHLSFDAGQREDRQIDHADDQRAEQARLDDLLRAREDRRRSARCASAARPRLMLLLGQQAQAVLDHDHRAVDDDAEVDRAQAHAGWR